MKTCIECTRFATYGAGVATHRGLEADRECTFVGCTLDKWRLWDGDWDATDGVREIETMPNDTSEFWSCIGWAATCRDFNPVVFHRVEQVVAELRVHYENTPLHLEEQGKGNSAGGLLHIVTEDGNLEDGHIQFCLEECEKYGDLRGLFIARSLLAMSMEEREEVYSRRDEYR